MKRILVPFFLLLTISLNAQYQKGFGGAFTIGMQTIPVADLAVFAPDMVPLPTTSFTVGGYGYLQLGKLTVGAKGGGYFGAESRDDDYVYKYGGGNFLIDVGYKLLATDRLTVYPVLGVGFYATEFNVAVLGAVDLAQVQKPDLNTSSFNIANVLFDAGIRLEYLVSFRSSDVCGKGGAMIGIEAGYQYSPPTDYWKASCGCPVYNVPEYSFKGFYANIIIGGFSGQKSSK